ncbi:helix-turn-helix transcriptional regulator [Umezawaea tangerina]|uniref:HTH-type transcriptional regulator RipA n=1 Tax=Umezawaea tangerina TaxID=84725 RepID=A0A2T0T2M0_9PSEU|nr:AraC family transcriptional regulator [Umezawaea tangerina]PRY39902.1 AraC-like DNA-binding protein [Umezawaea tangerina]
MPTIPAKARTRPRHVQPCRDTAQDHELPHLHSHPEPMLTWSSAATLMGTVAGRDWMIPPGYGLWVPGGVEHAGSVLHAGEMQTITFAADGCPIAWTEPTCVSVGSLPREIIRHLHRTPPDDRSRPVAEALMVELLTPLPPHHIHLTLPTDPRTRAVAEQLLAHPDDQRELTAWADHVHTSVRTFSRLFPAETGLTFATWRTLARIRAAIPLLANGTPVNTTARAVGYRKPGAFITAFRRTTGHTPGTYLPQPQ